MNLNLTVTGTGDALFLAPFPKEYDQKLKQLADFINACDVKITNLETNLTDYQFFASAYSGGTWLNTRTKDLDHLLKFGFNYFGNANNHAFDYSYDGLLSTIDTLDARNLKHSGTGRSLEDAQKPAFIQTENGVMSAIIAVDASFEVASKAGRATHDIKARPGVNYLRHESAFKINEEDLAKLKDIAQKTHINYNHDRLIQTGYETADPEGVFVFGKTKFTTNQDEPETKCNKDDLNRIVGTIQEAKQKADYVFVVVHCHTNDNVREENPAEYLIEFAHACIDNGAAAIFGGGCHRLRPVELYKNKPIFYSLGDFIYQGLKVEFLPADFMEKYGIDIYSTAEEALYARSKGHTIGLHCNKLNYQTVLPKLVFNNQELIEFSMLPVYLNFHRKDDFNGLPEIATGDEAEEILEILGGLSKPYGLDLILKDGMIIPA